MGATNTQPKKSWRSNQSCFVGKYIELGDAYLSVVEALRHACIEQKALLDLHWVSAEMIEKNSAETYLNEVDAIVVPGFGNRG